MNEELFVNQRSPDWDRLRLLVERAETGLNLLSGAELAEFIRLYRRASTDLSLARAKSTNLSLHQNLNDLVGKAYSVLYRAPSPPLVPVLLQALRVAAETVRRRSAFVLASFAIFFGAAFVAFAVMRHVPDSREAFISPAMDPTVSHWKSGKFEQRTADESSMMTGFYASNNPRVSIIAGAVGAGSFGFLSVFMAYQNGAMIGALAHEVDTVGQLRFLLVSVSPHGVPEISGLCMACAAGLLFGSALINPGRQGRSAALRAVSADGITLLVISVALTLIAAPIEGFFSFSPIVPDALKISVATCEALGWLTFWMFYGRPAPGEAHVP